MLEHMNGTLSREKHEVILTLTVCWHFLVSRIPGRDYQLPSVSSHQGAVDKR